MPQTESRLQYTLQLTDREFRLVTLGLAGMIIDQEDINESLKLNTQICHQRLTMVSQAKDMAAKALDNASAMQNPNVPPRKK